MKSLSNESYRFERKYLIKNIGRPSIEKMIHFHPAHFSELYKERYVNNIYFDSLEFNNFIDNIDGNMSRTKYRIRWYGDMFTTIKKPVLEVKIKKGMVGTKINYNLNQIEFKNGINLYDLKEIIENSDIDKKIKSSLRSQTPVICNRYKRKYYQSGDKKFRITIDDNQSFIKLNLFNNTFMQAHEDNSNIIMEIKYSKEYDSEVGKITNNFPFRITKSSKYAHAVELLYF